MLFCKQIQTKCKELALDKKCNANTPSHKQTVCKNVGHTVILVNTAVYNLSSFDVF